MLWRICFVSFLIAFSNSIYPDVSGYAQVIDGDTIQIGALRIRLSGIDTPELHQTCTRNDSIWKCGRESAEMTAHLIDEKSVRCIGNVYDMYDRLLAVCFSHHGNINSILVRKGMALAYRYYSSDYITEEEEARQNKIGLWSGEFVMPWEWRQGVRLP